MELDVLGIQDARPGARGHRQPVAARPGRVGGVAVNAPDAAGGQDGHRRQRAVDGFSLAVKDVCTVAGNWFVGCQRVTRVVGIGDQVHGGGLGQQFHVGALSQGGDQPLHDGPAGAVTHMQDAPTRMRAFLSIRDIAILFAVEGDARRADQDFLQQAPVLPRPGYAPRWAGKPLRLPRGCLPPAGRRCRPDRDR